jgi:hypothetical protein
MVETILQHSIFTNFIYPFLLLFFIVFAVLEKTKILGEDKKTLNAMIAFVIGLIFVSAVDPKLIVGNMILFLTVAIVIVFVVMILWGFVSADNKDGFKIEGWMKWVLWIVLGISTIVAIFYAVGFNLGEFLAKLPWTEAFFTNLIFIVLVAVALAVVIKSTSGKKS